MNNALNRSPWRVGMALAVAVMVACSWLKPFDDAATRQVDAGFQRALASFATARILNAVISVAQGTELAFQPAGVGVNFTVGQALDPVNDLVEQFGNLMLAATVVFGVEKMLILIGGHWLVSLLLTATAAAWALLWYRQRPSPPWLTRLLVVMLLVRFAMPAVTVGSDVVFQEFLARDYAASQQIVAGTAARFESADAAITAAPENPGLLEQLKGWVESRTTAWKDRVRNLKQLAEQATEHIIRLIVIFILQTLVIPLGMLWLLLVLVRGGLARK